MTNNSNKQILPAEWERKDAVLLAWPHACTDWAYMLSEVQKCYVDIIDAITRVATVLIVTPDVNETFDCIPNIEGIDNVIAMLVDTNDTWARDFGMICTVDTEGKWYVNDFKFNGWGLKFASNLDNLITRNVLAHRIIKEDAVYVNRLGFVLEGGSIDVDEGGKVMLTTEECLLSPNRNGDLNKEDIEKRLKDYFGSEKVVWLKHGALAGDDTDSHIDTLARFLPGGVIAYTSCDRQDDEHYDDLKKMEAELTEVTDTEGNPYRLQPLPIPEAIYDEEGNRLPATYANFLIINSTLFLPIYGDQKYDEIAIERIKEVLPESYTLVPLDCQALIQQHGSLHCITMQVPDELIDYEIFEKGLEDK